jgi:hypothetical protein
MTNYGFPSSADRRDTEPRGRVCAIEGCDTVLSRYNRADQCSVHAPATTSRTERAGTSRRGRVAPVTGGS